MHLPGPSWCPQPLRHLPSWLFSQEANSKPHISEDATKNTMAWATAGSRSGMGGYELHDQLSEQFFRLAGGYFANFSSSVGSNSEEIYSRQALYSSYTFISLFFVVQTIPTSRQVLIGHRKAVLARELMGQGQEGG